MYPVWLVVQRVEQEVAMDFHVIQYRMHLAVSLFYRYTGRMPSGTQVVLLWTNLRADKR